jgi:hypothetical protein
MLRAKTSLANAVAAAAYHRQYAPGRHAECGLSQLAIPVVDFAADDGASLLMAFRGLQADAYRGVARELDALLAAPITD